jgi:hypothetical protein
MDRAAPQEAAEPHGEGVDAGRRADATPSVETVLKEVRAACRHVRDAFRDLWR